MGYQVGNHCYATKEQAENAYFSLVAPVVQPATATTSTATVGRYPPSMLNPQTSQAKLLKPEFQNGRWVFNGQTVQANLPQCDPVKNFKDGQEVGWIVFAVIAAMYVFVLVKKQLR